MTMPAQADTAHDSQVVRVAGPRMTLSQRIWKLDWSKELPWTFGDVTVEHGTFADAQGFIAEHYAQAFPHDQRFLLEPFTEAKGRFCEEMDWFLFRHRDVTIGVFA